ncbi:MAG: hypothetical protein HNEKOMLI_00674 [Sodalis sp. Psp]|nr:hypothetical protein [Sodalis sp. Psp]MCR3757140.1 hypothetical protein [Sodalis sp. Ppy]
MQVLSRYSLYFLDSMTIANSQSVPAAAGTGVHVIKRNIFLDNTQNEADIRKQFRRTVVAARRNGSAVAIGHPHLTTVRMLQQLLPSLPSDIVLVRLSMLLNEKPGTTLDASHHCPIIGALFLSEECLYALPISHHQQSRLTSAGRLPTSSSILLELRKYPTKKLGRRYQLYSRDRRRFEEVIY